MPKSFRLTFRDEILKHGFARCDSSAVAASAEVSCIIEASLSRRVATVSYGLWFFDLAGTPAPNRYEWHHIYGGADRLCSLHTPIKRGGHVKTDDELQTQLRHIVRSAPLYARCLLAYRTVKHVVDMYKIGMFEDSLVRGEARAYLERLIPEL